ncbi:MAG: radical SAM protein [Treponema sp.]|nr:radical SAM protein [Treponema sp.]
MKIAIFGCRDGAYLNEQIKHNKNSTYKTVCFCDNKTELHGTYIDGLPVVSFEDLVRKYQGKEIESVIISVRKGYSRFRIIEQLQNAGVTKIILVKPSALTYRLPIVFDEKNPLYNLQWLDMQIVSKPIIHHLEANLADGCNLNCRGCLHFSNLYRKDEIPDSKELLDSIAEIAKHCEIFQFRVLGGEPLLNPDLEEFLIKLRKILPNTDLAVISNGILIPKMPESLFKTMRENYIGFNLTLYSPTLKMKDRIYEVFDKSGVAYGSHEAKTDKFEKFLLEKPGNVDARTHDVCVPRGILVVKEECIYRCPVEAYIDRFYEWFSMNLKAPDGINVHAFSGDWGQLITDLYTKPRPLCAYCSSKSEFYEWSNGKPEKADWLV